MFTDYTNASSLNTLIHTTVPLIYHIQCIVLLFVGYIVISVVYQINVGFERWFGGNVSASKVGWVNQALHGFLEFERLLLWPTSWTSAVGGLIVCESVRRHVAILIGS